MTTAQLKWTPVTPSPGAEPVTGYSVEAIAPAERRGNQQTSTGLRVG